MEEEKRRSIGEILQGMSPRDLGSARLESPHLTVRQPDPPKWAVKRPYDLHLCEELVVQEEKAHFHFFGSSDPYHTEGVADLYLATAGGEVLLRASCVPTRAGQELIVRRAGSDTELAYVEVVFMLDDLGHEVDRKIEIVSCYRIGGEYNPTFAHIERAEPGQNAVYHVRRGHHIHGGDKMLAIKRTPEERVMSFYHMAPLGPEAQHAIEIKVANLAPKGSDVDAKEIYWEMQARHRLVANLEDFGYAYTGRRRMQVRQGADLALIFCATIGVYKFDH